MAPWSMNRIGCVVGLFLLCATMLAPSAFAVDRRVPQDYPTLQAAVDAADDGDEIVVSPGTWQGFSVSNKSLKIRSTGSFATTRITSQCWINSAPNGFEFENITLIGLTLNTASTVLTWDRVRAAGVAVPLSGTARVALLDSELVGSQIYSANSQQVASNHSITRTIFRSNSSISSTGSLSVTASEFIACNSPISMGQSVTIDGSVFQGGIGGGAVSGNGVTISNSEVRDYESSTNRGAIYSTGAVTASSSVFVGCRFRNNTSVNGYGGAISAQGAITVTSCSFSACGAGGSGGGVLGGAIAGLTTDSVTSLADCTFVDCGGDESAQALYGGAVYTPGPLSVIRSSFTTCGGNAWYGGAIFASSGHVTLTDCSFVGNRTPPFSGGTIYQGGAVYFVGSASITRCRFIDNSAGSGGALVFQGGVPFASAFITECLFVGNTTISTNFGRDIAVPPTGQSAIAFLSQNTFCATEAQACSGFYFEKGPNTFGADCASDCDGDGLPNAYELKIGLDTDCNGNDIPDSCEAGSDTAPDCNANGIPDACDIANGAADCNKNGVPDTCEPDCDGDGIPNACEIAAGAADCDANGVPDSCQSDCNADGVIDACEITAGAADCNTNGIPDSCEIANGSAADFNKDAIPDSCQPEMQFAGLELEIVPIVNRGLDDLFPQTAICYRLYARTTVAGAAVVGLFGNNAHPLSINATGGFWQSPFGGDLASQIPCNLSGALPSAKYDSWFTIGLACAAGNSVQNTGLDLTAFNNGGGVNDNDGIIFVQPGAAQSIAGTSRRVLLAQLTTNSAVLPSGFIDVVGRSASGTAGWEAYNQAIPVPALVDCNNNGQQDAFEIALGTVRDCDQSGVPDTCEYGSASTDCNGNGVPDLCDVISAFSADLNGNFVPDECECSGDVDGNGRVDVDDIIDVIAAWGSVGDNPADVNNDDVVGAADLAIVLAGYGGCL